MMSTELEFLPLRGAINEAVDHAISLSISSSNIVEEGKWYGLVLSFSIMSVCHIEGSNYRVPLFPPPIPGLSINFTLSVS